jgi:hypothetical protein
MTPTPAKITKVDTKPNHAKARLCPSYASHPTNPPFLPDTKISPLKNP